MVIGRHTVERALASPTAIIHRVAPRSRHNHEPINAVAPNLSTALRRRSSGRNRSLRAGLLQSYRMPLLLSPQAFKRTC